MKNWETQQHRPTHRVAGGGGGCSVAPQEAQGPRSARALPLPLTPAPCLLGPRRQGRLPGPVPCAVSQGANVHLCD